MDKRLIVILFLKLVVVSCGSFINRDQLYIERITKIKFPQKTKIIQTFDNGEYQTEGKFIIPITEITSFSKKNNFLSLTQVKYYRKGFIMFLDHKNRPEIINEHDFFWLEDCNNSNHWRFLLNKNTGELWASVEYPDMGGDAPPCNK